MMATLRAYADPALRNLIGRSGTWASALEMPSARGQGRTKRVYVHNPTQGGILIRPEVLTPTGQFLVHLPNSVMLQPGVTSFPVEVTVGGGVPLPTAIDFAIGSIAATGESGSSPYSGSAYSGSDYTQSASPPVAASLRFEVTAFALPSADERFGDLGSSPLRNTHQFMEYIASGMGYADGAYKALMVDFMADKLYDLAIWAVNKHVFLNPMVSPMRLASRRAFSIGYDPPGLAGLPPGIRRRVYSRAFTLARNTGSAQGILGIMTAIGIPASQVTIWRTGFTWEVRVPQSVIDIYGADFLAQMALYHVDAYCVVGFGNQEAAVGHTYSDIDYTVEASPTIASGSILLEDGTSYLLLEDGSKIELEA